MNLDEIYLVLSRKVGFNEITDKNNFNEYDVKLA